jgi:hypothetical protein
VTAVPGLPDDATFYLGTGGAVLQFGPSGPDEVTATHLVRELSRAEALAIWDEQPLPKVTCSGNPAGHIPLKGAPCRRFSWPRLG